MISYLRVCPIQYRRNILEHLFNYIRGCVFVNKNVILGDIKEGWVRYQGDLGRIRGMGLEGMNGMDRSRSEVFTLQMEI